MSICDQPCDLEGMGYYANCNPQPRWGAGVKFPSQGACYDACVRSGDAGCGACSEIPACLKIPPPILRPPTPTEPGLPELPFIEGKIDPKLIIIGVIALILLLRR